MRCPHLEVLRERARPWLEKLRDRFDETTNLAILDGNHVTYLDIVESRRAVRLAASHEDRDPIHSTAEGKAVAAYLPEAETRQILEEEGMVRTSPNTITTIDGYLHELSRVRNLGYAVDNRENDVEGRSVAVRIHDARPPAAISMGAPAVRFPCEKIEEVAEELTYAARQIATKISGKNMDPEAINFRICQSS